MMKYIEKVPSKRLFFKIKKPIIIPINGSSLEPIFIFKYCMFFILLFRFFLIKTHDSKNIFIKNNTSEILCIEILLAKAFIPIPIRKKIRQNK